MRSSPARSSSSTAASRPPPDEGAGMPLDGVVPFPAEFAARYRERGYWRDRAAARRARRALRRVRRPGRAARRRRGTSPTARSTSRADRLARNLYDLGLRPLDRVVVQLPNDAAVRLPVRRPAEARRDPDHGAAAAPLPGAGAVRAAVRRGRLRRAGAGQGRDFREIVDRVRASASGAAAGHHRRRRHPGLPVAGRPARPRADATTAESSTRSRSTPTTRPSSSSPAAPPASRS